MQLNFRLARFAKISIITSLAFIMQIFENFSDPPPTNFPGDCSTRKFLIANLHFSVHDSLSKWPKQK